MKRLPILQLILLWLLSCGQLALADRITYFHYDATGTAIMATDEQANVLWKRAPTAYGETPEFHPAMKKYNHRMTVAGHYDDWETGLIYMGKRYYSPKLGRFLTPDPVGVHPHLPQSFNRYGYANNNPYRFVDPDGRNAVEAFGGILTESWNGLLGRKFNSQLVWGALKDGYDGEGAGFWRSAVDDVLAFGGGAIGAASKLYKAPISRILNLGSGKNPMQGAVNVDISANAGVNVVADANKLPFKSGVFTEAHSVNPYGFNPVNAETARVLQPGATLKVTGTARNSFSQPLSASQARAAGFDIIETTPIQNIHKFGAQTTTKGGILNTSSSTTTVYRRLP